MDLKPTEGTSLSSLTGSSLPIRAPLTLDSDSDYQENSNTSYTSSSDNGFGSEGFVSGEEEVDAASERPYFADPDDETLEQSRLVEIHAVSRPFVTHPDDETLEQSSVVEIHTVSRPFATHPDDETLGQSSAGGTYAVSRSLETSPHEEFAENSSVGENFTVYRSIGTNPDEEIVEKTSVVEEFVVSRPLVSDTDEDTVGRSMGSRVLLLPKMGVPIAMLSGDSDDDSAGSEVVEDDGFSGVVRVPGIGIAGEFGNAPKVKISEVEIDVVEDVDFGEVVYGDLSIYEEEGIVIKESVEETLLAELDEMNCPDVTEEPDVKSLVVSQKYVPFGNAEMDEDVKYPVEEVQAPEFVEQNIWLDEKSMAVACEWDKEIFDGGKVSTVIDYAVQSNHIEADKDVGSSKEADLVVNGMDLQGTVVIDVDETSDHANVKNGIQCKECSKALEPCETLGKITEGDVMEENVLEPASLGSNLDPEVLVESIDEVEAGPDKLAEADGGVVSYENTANQFTGEKTSGSGSWRLAAESDEESERHELLDSEASALLLKAAKDASQNDSSSVRPNFELDNDTLRVPGELVATDEIEEILSEEEKKKLEKIQQIRIVYLRLVQRLGRSIHDPIVEQVLQRLVLAAGKPSCRAFDLEFAKTAAMEVEAKDKSDLNFSLNILVIGKTGVGKSAIINSIFGEERTTISAFEHATTTVKEIVGTIDGVKVRLLDTPGLRSCVTESRFNCKTLSSVKKKMKKFPPDVILYVDRLDSYIRDHDELPLLKSITDSLGSSTWRNAVFTLTHASSIPPEGPSGPPFDYEGFVTQRAHVINRLISHAVGKLGLTIPVSLVENHPSCKKHGNGQLVLPNGETWKTQLLLLCYSKKILSEAHSVMETRDLLNHRQLPGFCMHSPSLPYFLSSLLQSYFHPKLSSDQGGENVGSDIDLGSLSDSDLEDEDEYDQLPPFKPLKMSQLDKLSKDQQKAYYKEYDYRVKLLQKKQLMEVKRMRKLKKKREDDAKDYGCMEEDGNPESASPNVEAVPLPDKPLPPSFDGDDPIYRYRSLEPRSQLHILPIMDSHGWDHDYGYDGVNLEDSLAIAGRFPAVVAVHMKKDKKDFNVHLDSSVSAKLGENGSIMGGFDIETHENQIVYILKGETKLVNFKRNRAAAGVSMSLIGKNVITGVKVEDEIAVTKRLVLVGCTGAVRFQGDAAYGANLEVRLKEKDLPIGQDQAALDLSLVHWKGDLLWGCNLKSQFSVGRSTKMAILAGLNKQLNGQITVRMSSSEQLHIALLGLLPITKTILKNLFPPAERYTFD
ncbi:hypothetical protein RJ640_014828 [Escallonia rubra]|uniref:AIG1-type G domain-containing protein n=1 Tax=Escallonia rubra TaxID=112253 RepID=A0AA88UQX8_9ASTE|nr:hypothetical protein RJ640_014828 [Escallonia rubra]